MSRLSAPLKARELYLTFGSKAARIGRVVAPKNPVGSHTDCGFVVIINRKIKQRLNATHPREDAQWHFDVVNFCKSPGLQRLIHLSHAALGRRLTHRGPSALFHHSRPADRSTSRRGSLPRGSPNG